jgi:hypothetical protein
MKFQSKAWLLAVSLLAALLLAACDQVPETVAPAGGHTPQGPLIGVNPSAVQTPQANQGVRTSETPEPARPPEASGQEQEQGAQNATRCASGQTNPQFAWLAAATGATADEIAHWFCAGYGFGEIRQAYGLSARYGLSVEQIFAMRAAGGGWGQIKRALAAGSAAGDGVVPLLPYHAGGGNGHSYGNGNGNGHGHGSQDDNE